ncbi:MAG: hypothetical protein Q8O43_06720 [Dehalococcoidia bacterium]|nr:hypothetical protein [Dehalococcoidia bacterium]
MATVFYYFVVLVSEPVYLIVKPVNERFVHGETWLRFSSAMNSHQAFEKLLCLFDNAIFEPALFEVVKVFQFRKMIFIDNLLFKRLLRIGSFCIKPYQFLEIGGSEIFSFPLVGFFASRGN